MALLICSVFQNKKFFYCKNKWYILQIGQKRFETPLHFPFVHHPSLNKPYLTTLLYIYNNFSTKCVGRKTLINHVSPRIMSLFWTAAAAGVNFFQNVGEFITANFSSKFIYCCNKSGTFRTFFISKRIWLIPIPVAKRFTITILLQLYD